MTEKQDKVAIVTGASRGIGAEIATSLSADGFAVVVSYASSAGKADLVANEIGSDGGRAITVQADLSEPGEAKALFDAAEEAFGAVDVLINNAGIMHPSPIADTDDATFDRHLAVNLGGPFRTMREAATRLRDGGRIVNFSSSVVGLYQPAYGAYAASKAALEAMTRIAAKELAPRRITVNAVAPGPVATELFLADKSEDAVAAIASRIPLGRLGQPEDIARVVRFLASAESGWISGQSIRANGGMI